MTNAVKNESSATYLVAKKDAHKEKALEDAVIAEAIAILQSRLAEPESYITSPDSAAALVQLKLTEHKHEVFAVLWLDNRHGVLGFEELTAGTIDGTTIPPRLVVQKALEVNAAAVVFAHNHPSGASEPSQADLRITQRLRDALALVDIRVLDHLIVGREVVSFADRGLL